MTTSKLRIGLTRYAPGLLAQADWAKLVEDLGFDLIGYGDTQNLQPDCYVSMTAMAMRTERVMIGQTVSNPVTRHPSVTASAMSALQEVSGGRAFLGIGTGDSALINIGEKPATRAYLEDYCLTVRGLCEGREVTWCGAKTKLQFAPQRVPIWIAAEGPRMQELAGRIGDGVIFANGITEDVVKDNLRRVRAGAVAAGRDPDAVEAWFLVKPYFADSPEKAWRDLAWTLSASANHAFRFTLEGKFVPPEFEAGMRRLMDGYASHQHNVKGAGSHNAALVIDNGLIEFLGPRFLLAGTPQQIVTRIEEMTSWGATNFIMPLIFGDPVEDTRRFAAEVLEPLKKRL